MDDYCQGIGNVYEHLSEVGLPNNSKIRQFTANNSCVSDYDEAYTELFTWLKNNASFGLSYGDNLINGLEDYTYLGVCFFHDDIVQERKETICGMTQIMVNTNLCRYINAMFML